MVLYSNVWNQCQIIYAQFAADINATNGIFVNGNSNMERQWVGWFLWDNTVRYYNNNWLIPAGFHIFDKGLNKKKQEKDFPELSGQSTKKRIYTRSVFCQLTYQNYVLQSVLLFFWRNWLIYLQVVINNVWKWLKELVSLRSLF